MQQDLFRYQISPIRKYISTEQRANRYPIKEYIKVIRLHAHETLETLLQEDEKQIYQKKYYSQQPDMLAQRTIECKITEPDSPNEHILHYLEYKYGINQPEIINKIISSMAYVGFKIERKEQKEELILAPARQLEYVNSRLTSQLKKHELFHEWREMKENFYGYKELHKGLDFFMQEGRKIAQEIEMTLLYKN